MSCDKQNFYVNVHPLSTDMEYGCHRQALQNNLCL